MACDQIQSNQKSIKVEHSDPCPTPMANLGNIIHCMNIISRKGLINPIFRKSKYIRGQGLDFGICLRNV